MRDNSAIYLSVVIPAYNEALRLPDTLNSIFNYFDTKDYNFEVIVVDDGSKDNTVDVVKSNKNYSDSLKVISQPRNKGKGAAVRKGFAEAAGELIIFNDADGSSPIEEIEKLIEKIQNGYDVAIGSRALKTSDVDDLWYRRIMGITFNTLIGIFVIYDFKDTQCGFKLFKRDCAKNIFNQLHLNGFSFDVEILFLAKKLGYKIAEVPISWHCVAGSKINLFVDSPLMFMDILKIRLMYILGKYKIK